MLNETKAIRIDGGTLSLRAFCAFEGEGGDGGNGNGNGNDGGQNNGGQNGGQGNGQQGDQRNDDANGEAARRRHENAELQSQLQAAQAELEQFKAKERTDLENATTERDREKTGRESAEQEAQRLRIENAFLRSNKHTWHNPADALKMADLTEVTIKDGKVEGLDKALDKLATDSPYLLKKVEEGNGGQGNGQQDQNGGTPTAPGGTPPAGQGGEKYSREAMEKKYPTLRGRFAS